MINYALKLNKIKFLVYLGVYEHEIKNLQTIYVDLLIIFHTQPTGCKTDNIKDTLCYEHINNIMKKAINKKKFKLLEYIGQYLLNSIIKNINTKNIDIKVEIFKNQPISNITSTSFFLEFLCKKI